MDFVQIILNNLMSVLPFVVLKTYQRGVRWKFGRSPMALEPGYRLRLPLMHQVETFDIADEVMECPVQSIITKDEKLVCFSVSVGFRVVDVVKHATTVQDFIGSTQGVAMVHLAKRVREKTLKELIEDLTKLEKSLEATMTNRMKDWGTEVFYVGFTDFAEVPQQIRVFGGQGILPLHR
jgi:regulator of protease activity HflC (stomatin/prohibitin superfamily)